MKGLDDSVDGLNEAAFDRAMAAPIKPARRSSKRKPKETPFAKAARKIDLAFRELDEATRKLSPEQFAYRSEDGLDATTFGHWQRAGYICRNGEVEDMGPVWVRAAWVTLLDADQLAALFDGIRECCK